MRGGRALAFLLAPAVAWAAGSGSLPRAGSSSSSPPPSRASTSSSSSSSSSSAARTRTPRSSRGLKAGGGVAAAPRRNRAAPRPAAAPSAPVVAGMQGSSTSLAGVPGLVQMTYESGRKRSAEADALMASAGATASTVRSHELRARAAGEYRRAAAAFEEVVAASPRLYQAWNQLGYARRRAGDHPGALQAYAMALRLQPGYGPAIEYRAEAHLALGRLGEVRDAYRELFASEPALAAQLAEAIQAWLRQGHPEVAEAELAGFRQWYARREQLAEQAGDPGESWVGEGH